MPSAFILRYKLLPLHAEQFRRAGNIAARLFQLLLDVAAFGGLRHFLQAAGPPANWSQGIRKQIVVAQLLALAARPVNGLGEVP